MTVGFSFDYKSTNQSFAPDALSREMAASAGDCLAEFAQIVDSAWYMGGSATLTPDSATTLELCATACKGDADCQYFTYNYEATAGQKCQLKKTEVGST